MSLQFDTTSRNDWLTEWIANVGASPKLILYGNDPPANCAAAPSAEVRCTITCPSSPFGTPSGGQVSKSGTWSNTPSALGPIEHFRLWNNAVTTCFMQGTVTQAFAIATSASTGVNGNVLTFADTTGVQVGDGVYAEGVPLGAEVLAVTSTTVTLSVACPAGVSSGVTVNFGSAAGDITIGNTTVTSLSQAITISEFTLVAPGA
jgi:hypothetical protein